MAASFKYHNPLDSAVWSVIRIFCASWKLAYFYLTSIIFITDPQCSPFEVNCFDFSHKELKESGKITLTRLLTAVEQIRPDLCFIPVINISRALFAFSRHPLRELLEGYLPFYLQAMYPLADLFLNYMNEEEAFVCLINLLSPCHKFLIQTDISTNATKRTLITLIKKHAVYFQVFKFYSQTIRQKSLSAVQLAL